MTMFREKDAWAQRMLQASVLDPLAEALGLIRRVQENEGFRQYLRANRVRVVPLAAAAILTSMAGAGAVVLFMQRGAAFLVLIAMVLAPLVLAAGLWVHAHVILSWLEGRSLIRALGRRAVRARGPLGAWLERKVRIDFGPAPRVPWMFAAIFVLLPLALLSRMLPAATAALLLFQAAAVVLFARFDR